MTKQKPLTIPNNPYGRLLDVNEVVSLFKEWGYDVSQYKLRLWRMDKMHPLQYYKKSETRQGHCFYKWEDLHAFRQMIVDGAVML